MKTLRIILCVLAITTMAYGFNLARYYRLHMNLCMCEKDWYAIYNNYEPHAAKMFRCATLRDGNIHDDDGQYELYAMSKFLEDVIQNEYIVEKAQLIFKKCYYRSYKENVDHTISISECAYEILLLIGNPNIL